MKKKPKCLYVEWLDHGSSDGWVKTERLSLEPLVCKTVGWVLKEDKTVMVLGSTLQYNMLPDHSNARSHILKSAIIRKKVLK